MPPPRHPSLNLHRGNSTLTRPTTQAEATTALTVAAPAANQALAATVAMEATAEATVDTVDTAVAIIRTDIDSSSLTTVAGDIERPPYFY